MKKIPNSKIRNIAIISHGGAGKTSLAESMLYTAGAVSRLGRVDDGTSIFDYDQEEIKRKITINTSMAPCEWEGHKINIIDTPGYFDFVGEVKGALRVVDGTILVLCAASGVEVGTEIVYDYAEEQGLPKIIFVNKMDRENANFFNVIDELKEKYGNKVVPLQIPIGAEANFKGIVDILKGKAYIFEGDKKYVEGDIPKDLLDKVEEYKEALTEAVAEGCDELLMKYLEGEELTEEEIMQGLKEGVKERKILPVLCGSAYKNIGIPQLLSFINFALPSPIDKGKVKARLKNEDIEINVDEKEKFTALVFKTMADPYVGKLTFFRVYSGTLKSDSVIYNATKKVTERVGQLFLMKGKNQEPVDFVQAGDIAAVAKLQETSTGDTLCEKDMDLILAPVDFPRPVISFAVEPKSKNDEEKVSSGLARFLEEDPTFKVERNAETKQTIISGMGELHLEIIVNRLSKKFGVDVDLKNPKIPYKETIKGKAKVEGKHKKQSGGRGQYGHVWIEFEPLPRGEKFQFVDKIFGGAVPRNYIPAVEKGLIEAMEEGILAGYPVVDIKATLFDGSYHSVDSSEMAFKIAASLAFKKAMQQAQPVLLEPIVNAEIIVPEQFMGDIMGDMNSRRGRIMGMEPLGGGLQKVKAQAPLAEMYRYSIDLRSMTQGRGSFTMEYSHYEEVPPHIQEQIVKEAQREKELASK
ncbi:elongation factor G [Anaerobranca gottschalkii]|uniref:Elongation factor G n=1 Tax=Anaerobranca gottschalkii DSM 13577 TaxID=1120990 RepID=A0A1I0BD41_9FIRM|nr:elongation factor G [Anaerobranca gottschalkii]SET04102.1 elongation factor G [Anaerobranca gottschalkii DSM 13577]